MLFKLHKFNPKTILTKFNHIIMLFYSTIITFLQQSVFNFNKFPFENLISRYKLKTILSSYYAEFVWAFRGLKIYVKAARFYQRASKSRFTQRSVLPGTCEGSEARTQRKSRHIQSTSARTAWHHNSLNINNRLISIYNNYKNAFYYTAPFTQFLGKFCVSVRNLPVSEITK